MLCLEEKLQKVKRKRGKVPKVQCGFDAFGDVTGFSSTVCI